MHLTSWLAHLSCIRRAFFSAMSQALPATYAFWRTAMHLHTPCGAARILIQPL